MILFYFIFYFYFALGYYTRQAILDKQQQQDLLYVCYLCDDEATNF